MALSSPTQELRLPRGRFNGSLKQETNPQPELDDHYLVALAKEGRTDAYDAIVRRYRGFVRLKASSYFLLGGESDDLIQEGLLGLYKASATTAATASRASAASPSSASPARSSPR